jgi:transketolase
MLRQPSGKADAALIGCGPVLMANACGAADDLAAEGIRVTVINLPWLNRIDDTWVKEALAKFPVVVTLDNHYLSLGQGEMIAAAIARNGVRTEVRSIGLTEIPACGTNAEVLAHHGLDRASIAGTVRSCIHTKSFTG